MCGIYFSLSHRSVLAPDNPTKLLLHSRGPDSAQQYDVEVSFTRETTESTAAAGPITGFATFYSTVLSLRGDHTVAQPLVDDRSGSVLCWNGEAWETGNTRITGNDSVAVFELLLHASASSIAKPEDAAKHVSLKHALSLINGPFAFVFYDRPRAVIYFGRDRLGRRSLLRRIDGLGNLYLSSVCTGISEDAWEEVEADGLYAIDLRETMWKREAQLSSEVSRAESTPLAFEVRHVPYRYRGSKQTFHLSIKLPWPPLNNILPTVPYQHLKLHSSSLQHIEDLLRASLLLRVSNIPAIHSVDSRSEPFYPTSLAILFSGGLDCTLLARISDDILPRSEPIDLLNVAFENPRVHSPRDTQSDNPYESCPDRITARASLFELQRRCPERTWRLVEIDVPYAQTRQHRETIIKLIHPHDTEMDLSIACALYFAARGSGVVRTSRGPSTLFDQTGNTYAKPETIRYTTSARVLLSGLGADELFGGYQRHALAFARQSFSGLIAELALDFERLGKRNLGRDDRVISHWGREVRYPYLDEKVVTWALERPVWAKCGFGEDGAGKVSHVSAIGNGDAEMEPVLEPGKKILRLLAWQLGMVAVAREKKRAIQFGARTAKMEIGRTKGTQKIS